LAQLKERFGNRKLMMEQATEKLSRSAKFAQTPLWTSLPTKRKNRDTTSAEGAVGSSEC